MKPVSMEMKELMRHGGSVPLYWYGGRILPIGPQCGPIGSIRIIHLHNM